MFSIQMSLKSFVGSTFTGAAPNVKYCFSTSVNGGAAQGADCLLMQGGCSGGTNVGESRLLGSGEETAGGPVAMPTAYELHANYPNPFNPSTVINYDLPEASMVRLSIYNILGQEVATLVNGVVEGGYRSVTWNADEKGGVPSGIYIYRMQATSLTTGKEFVKVNKMVLMK